MSQASLKRHYWVRSLIVTGFTLLLAKLIVTERLGHYLAPRLHMFSYVTLGILVILTFVSIRQALSGTNGYECDCEDAHQVPRSLGRSLFVYGMFVLPLAMGFLMPEQILGSDAAEKRGVTLLSSDVRKLAAVTGSANASAQDKSAASGQQQAGAAGGVPAPAGTVAAQESAGAAGKADSPTAQQGGKPDEHDKQASSAAQGKKQTAPLTDEQIRQKFASGLGDFYTDMAVSLYKQPVIQLDDKVFLDGLTTMELYAKEFAGKEIETMGFVYRQQDFTPQQFVVARFSVSCCTADASVFGVLVEHPQASKWATDSWVKVRGKLESRMVDGYDMLVLKATRVEPVKAPKDPYVYYNYNTPAGG